MIFAGEQDKSAVVLYVLSAHLSRSVYGKLHRIAHVTHLPFVAVEGHADDIESGFVLITGAGEWDLRSRNGQRDGDKEFVVTDAEVAGGEVKRQIRGRQVGIEFLLELALTVILGGMLVVGRSI